MIRRGDGLNKEDGLCLFILQKSSLISFRVLDCLIPRFIFVLAPSFSWKEVLRVCPVVVAGDNCSVCGFPAHFGLFWLEI